MQDKHVDVHGFLRWPFPNSHGVIRLCMGDCTSTCMAHACCTYQQKGTALIQSSLTSTSKGALAILRMVGGALNEHLTSLAMMQKSRRYTFAGSWQGCSVERGRGDQRSEVKKKKRANQKGQTPKGIGRGPLNAVR